MKRELLQILRSDVKPALGCTGPVSISLAAALALDAVGGKPQFITLRMDRDTYKNSISVASAGTEIMGVHESAALGALYGKSAYGLEVLKDMETVDQAAVEAFARDQVKVEILWERKAMGLYIEAFAETEKGTGHGILARTHDGVVLQEANGVVLQKDETYNDADVRFEAEKPIRQFSVRDLYDFATQIPLEDIAFLKEAAETNYRLAEEGLRAGSGSGFGKGFQALGDTSMYQRAKMMAAAASDARMGGVALPAISCAGSGNVGITGSVPLVEVAKGLGCGDEALVRGLALSYLLVIYGKAHIGRLSTMCACAIVASMGIAAGTCLMMGGKFEQVEDAINNLLGSLGGVLCDGAKYACAMKLATGAGVAIESAQLAMGGVKIAHRDGVVGDTAEDTIGFLGRLASEGMLSADVRMCEEIILREGRIPVEPHED